MGFVLKGVFCAPRIRGYERTIRKCEADWASLTWFQLGQSYLMHPKARGKTYRKWINWCQRRENRNRSQDREGWIEKDGGRCEPNALGWDQILVSIPGGRPQGWKLPEWSVPKSVRLNLPSRIWSDLEPAVGCPDQKNMNRRSLVWTFSPLLKRLLHPPLVGFWIVCCPRQPGLA